MSVKGTGHTHTHTQREREREQRNGMDGVQRILKCHYHLNLFQQGWGKTRPSDNHLSHHLGQKAMSDGEVNEYEVNCLGVPRDCLYI